MNTIAIQRFKEIIEEIDLLINKRVSRSSPDFQAWKTKTDRFLIQNYGENSYEYKQFRGYRFTLSGYVMGTPRSKFVDACVNDLQKVKAVFLNYLVDAENAQEIEGITKSIVPSSIFIVHGHDGELKQLVARLLERQRIHTIILNEQVNKGKTIIEKIEEYGNVGAAICLFTSDDLGREENDTELKYRARQNVVFETGYFAGRLGRERVVIIADNSIELPSDLSGVVYYDKKDWQVELFKELKEMGFSIDFNLLFF